MKWLDEILGPPAPPAPPKPAPVYRPPSALEIIERQLQRIHSEMEDHTSGSGPGYLKLIEQLDKLHGELIRRSQEESKLAGS